MRWKYKFVTTLAVAGFLALGGSAWAEGKYSTVKVYFEKLNMAINGQQVETSKESLLYNGSVYVPIRNLSELLGAEVVWNDLTRTVDLNFIADQSNELFTASQKGVYQYIALQNNLNTRDLIKMFNDNNFQGMEQVVARFEQISKLAADIDDPETSLFIDKMKASMVLLQTGWANKEFDEYMIAWNIYSTYAKRLNAKLSASLVTDRTFSIE
jgi:hypothetical protein